MMEIIADGIMLQESVVLGSGVASQIGMEETYLLVG